MHWDVWEPVGVNMISVDLHFEVVLPFSVWRSAGDTLIWGNFTGLEGCAIVLL